VFERTVFDVPGVASAGSAAALEERNEMELACAGWLRERCTAERILSSTSEPESEK
jgi:hypothetical protein